METGIDLFVINEPIPHHNRLYYNTSSLWKDTHVEHLLHSGVNAASCIVVEESGKHQIEVQSFDG